MKSNRTLFCILTFFVAGLLQSCLKDQEDIFDTPSALRMQEVLDNAKKTLTGSEEGWVFDYYPDRYQSYGGYVYTLKFDDRQVSVGFEWAPGMFESSLYKLTNDNGPVLSFDSYNTMMHYFATPSFDLYESFDGDFEFIIMDVTDDQIKLRGKRTGNTMYLHRLTRPAADYIDAVVDLGDNMIFSSGTGTWGGSEISCELDMDYRHIYLTYVNGGELLQTEASFILTENGIRFYDPVELDGATLAEMNLDVNTSTLTGTDSEGNAVTIVGKIAEDYARFPEFEGKYDFVYYFGSIEVTLVPDSGNDRYLIRGLNPNYDVVATYVKSKGCLNITSQKVGDSGNQQIWFCGWDADDGYFSWSTDCGMYVKKNMEQDGTFDIVPNDYIINSAPANSYIVRVFNGEPSSNTSVGNATAPWLVNNSYQLPYLEKLVRK